jgi:hypothetical protein
MKTIVSVLVLSSFVTSTAMAEWCSGAVTPSAKLLCCQKHPNSSFCK